MKDKRTAHTQSELLDIFKEKQIEEKYFSKFLDYYKVCFEELDKTYTYHGDNFIDEEDSVQNSALIVATRFLENFLESIINGHGEEWAYHFAHNLGFGEMAIYHAYSSLKKINPHLAKQELLIHANSLSGDNHFRKHYIFLFEVGDDPIGRIEKARNYSEIFKGELAGGKSEVYAHQYADLRADNRTKVYCREYAFAYANAISTGKSTAYAKIYADKCSSSLVNIKRRNGISDHKKEVDFAIEKVNAFMNAWEYAQENKLENFDRFASIYESKYLNTYFSNDGELQPKTAEIDKIVLEKTLKVFDKLKK